MKDIEMKKMSLQRAIVSLLAEWKDLKALLDFSTNPMLNNEEGEKLNEIDLNERVCDDSAQVLEIQGKKLKRIMGNDGLCEKKVVEIEEKMREMEFSKSFIEERAKELELRQKEIDDGFRDLEVKKREFAEKCDKVDGIISVPTTFLLILSLLL